jgi:hypothetical protein
MLCIVAMYPAYLDFLSFTVFKIIKKAVYIEGKSSLLFSSIKTFRTFLIANQLLVSFLFFLFFLPPPFPRGQRLPHNFASASRICEGSQEAGASLQPVAHRIDTSQQHQPRGFFRGRHMNAKSLPSEHFSLGISTV